MKAQDKPESQDVVNVSSSGISVEGKKKILLRNQLQLYVRYGLGSHINLCVFLLILPK